MPDTLCRRCGSELLVHLKCLKCFKAIQHICPKCQYTPLKKFHMNCVLMSRRTSSSRRKLYEVLAA